ncbi:hypothetical protein D9M69_640720 [compost metagenome]
MFAIHHLATALPMPAGNAVAQPTTAAHFRIVRITGQQAGDGGLDNGLRRIEVGVANGQQQDVDALFAQVQRSIVNLPGRRTVTGDSLGQG